MKAPSPNELEIELDGDELTAAEQFCAWGWTDGLPIVAPTPARVEAMCEAAQRPAPESLGELAPGGGPATVQKIAINAVMAGLRPELLPVLLAAVEAVLESDFNLFAVQTTTHPCGAMLLLHGPLAARVGVNSGAGCMGPGNRANATLGRALRLVLQNVGQAFVGEMDRATQGSPAKYSFCFAESEAGSPWPPLRQAMGLELAQSYVTVAAAEGPHNINDHGSTTADSLLNTIAQTMATVGNNNLYVGGDTFLVLGPEHAQTLAEHGLSREEVQERLYEAARVPVERISAQKLEELAGFGGWGDRLAGWGRRIPLVREPQHLRVVVAGGPGKHSCWIPCFGASLSSTRRIVER